MNESYFLYDKSVKETFITQVNKLISAHGSISLLYKNAKIKKFR